MQSCADSLPRMTGRGPSGRSRAQCLQARISRRSPADSLDGGVIPASVGVSGDAPTVPRVRIVAHAFAAALRAVACAFGRSGRLSAVVEPSGAQNGARSPLGTMTPCAGRGKLPRCSGPSTGRTQPMLLARRALRRSRRLRRGRRFPFLRAAGTFGSGHAGPPSRARSGSCALLAQDAAVVSGGAPRDSGRKLDRVSRKNVSLQVDESRTREHFNAVVHDLERWR